MKVPHQILNQIIIIRRLSIKIKLSLAAQNKYLYNTIVISINKGNMLYTITFLSSYFVKKYTFV